jgi:hypothetical protein
VSVVERFERIPPNTSNSLQQETLARRRLPYATMWIQDSQADIRRMNAIRSEQPRSLAGATQSVFVLTELLDRTFYFGNK